MSFLSETFEVVQFVSCFCAFSKEWIMKMNETVPYKEMAQESVELAPRYFIIIVKDCIAVLHIKFCNIHWEYELYNVFVRLLLELL